MIQFEKSATQNVRVESITRLAPPSEYWRRYPLPDAIRGQVEEHRHQIEGILSGRDRRMLMIVGPCSIHDTEMGLDYARRLAALAKEVEDRIVIAMRIYFEKPRTTVGWKGFINDPNLNGSYDVQGGMARARQFLIEVCGLGLPVATEFLGVVHPPVPRRPRFLGSDRREDDGESATQAHGKRPEHADGIQERHGRERDIAIDGIVAAMTEHVFFGIDDDGLVSVVKTTGNPASHLVLRGGKAGPNYDAQSVASAQRLLKGRGLVPNLVVDCSHANSNKDYRMQSAVFDAVLGSVLPTLE